MLSLNRAQIIGNLTKEAELKFTPNGKAVATFGVATNKRWKDTDGNLQEQVEFHNIVMWGNQAETLAPMITKGSPIFVEGRLQTRSWEKDGIKRYSTEIVADNVILLGGRRSETTEAEPTRPETEEVDISEIPF